MHLPLDPSALVRAGGPGKSQYALHTAGEGFLDWGTQAGVNLDGCAHEVSVYAGVSFAAKTAGNGTFRFNVSTLLTSPVEYAGECVEGCFDHYAYDVVLKDDGWYECNLRFRDLTQQGWGTTVGVELQAVDSLQQSFAAGVAFDLTLDDVRFERKIARSGCTPIADPSCDERRHPHHHRPNRHYASLDYFRSVLAKFGMRRFSIS